MPSVQPHIRKTQVAQVRTLPKAPVLDWSGLWSSAAPNVPNVFNLPNRGYLTSGRAALFAALQQLQLPQGSAVLVPTYHCPTMVAPVLKSGLVPHYFPIGPDGLPLLEAIAPDSAKLARVMFVAHYFGLPKSLASVKAWCEKRQIVLVEDCAHAYFGQAGERPVGQWGDYATASLSKFFPLAEAGLLASATRPLLPLQLARCGAVAQAKGLVDVLEFAGRHHRLAGVSHLLAPFFWLKNRRHPDQRSADPLAEPPPGRSSAALMEGCDMGRIQLAPTLAARALHQWLALGPIVAARRANYAALSKGLAGAVGARALEPELPESAAPYVCPVWIDGPARADLVYAQLREAGLPVFRWDQIWPGTPAEEHDTGPRWSRQVIQLLCHQSLTPNDTAQLVQSTKHFLQRA